MPNIVLKDGSHEPSTYSNVGELEVDTEDGSTTKYISEHLIQNQEQADWDQTDSSKPDYIKNKPTIKDQVQSDWSQSDSTKPDFIKNKPTIKDQVQSDWSQSDSTQPDFIKNKPTIVQANWNQIDSTRPDYIRNKPTIPSTEGLATEKYVDDKFANSGALPEVNESDNGKILGVVSGMWQKIVPSGSGGSGMAVQPDWNQNDNSQADYIKNRPFYTGDPVVTEVIPETPLPFNLFPDEGLPVYVFIGEASAEQVAIWNSDWEELTFVWDNVTYTTKPQEIEGEKAVGNVPAMMGTGNTGEPFIMIMSGSMILLASLFDEVPADPSTAETKYHSISISCKIEEIVKVPTKYLYQPDWEENDESSGAYIKNKPFGVYHSGDILLDGELYSYGTETSDDGTSYHVYYGTPNMPIIPGNGHALQFIVNGEEYTGYVQGSSYYSECRITLSDSSQMDITFWDSSIRIYTQLADTITITITLHDNEYVKIPSGYLPDSLQLPTPSSSFYEYVLSVDGNGNWTMRQVRELPSVSSQYDGYILKVVNGKWQRAYNDALPIVDNTDNGKVLSVVDGAWTAKTPASGLPAVTTNDAGKFLRVSVDGSWIAETIPNAEGASF